MNVQMQICPALLNILARSDSSTPTASALHVTANLLLMLMLPPDTWLRLVIWLVIGLVIYFGYGYKRSSVREREGLAPAT